MAETVEVRVPDIGDFDEVDVVEVLVAAGDEVDVDDSLITLESDKASMEVPSTAAGVVREVKVKVGDKVGEGAVIVVVEPSSEGGGSDEGQEERQEETRDGQKKRHRPNEEEDEGGEEERAERREEHDGEEEEAKEDRERRPAEPDGDSKRPQSLPQRREPPTEMKPEEETGESPPHASPSVRRFARTLGVDLRRVQGSGRKGRILKGDVESFVEHRLREDTAGAAPSGTAELLPEMPKVDFSKYGEVERKPLSRIRRLSARNVHRSWLHVPHVTQHDEADVTEMESFRKAESPSAKEKGFKLTPLVFIMKAVVEGLREFPDFNASLDADGETLVLKKYFHLGIAVDTEDGLVVPVIRDVDKKGLFELGEELAGASARAREGKMRLDEMQGGCFTISSLGGIGGTAFTPIVSAPEVAILGVSRTYWKPVLQDGEFVPRLMLPLSLSYDHRVIDGATAVRFTTYLGHLLGDVRRLLL